MGCSEPIIRSSGIITNKGKKVANGVEAVEVDDDPLSQSLDVCIPLNSAVIGHLNSSGKLIPLNMLSDLILELTFS